MSTSSPPEMVTDQTTAVLRVFREAKAPLTVAQAKRLYSGPKLKDKDWDRLIAEQLMEGKFFECFPAGRNKRFWVHDEKQRIRDEIEKVSGEQPLSQNGLRDTVSKTLTGVSSKTAVERCLAEMVEEGFLHKHPGRARNAVLLSAYPFDPLSAARPKKATIDDLKGILSRLQPFGLTLDDFLTVLQNQLQSAAEADGNTGRQPARRGRGTKAEAGSDHSSRDHGINGNGAGASNEPAQPLARNQTEELEQLILKGMRDLEPQADQGAPVLLRELRRHMHAKYRQRETFDPVVIGLAERGLIVLHRHDQPSFLSDAERAELVQDDTGTYYTAIAHRV